MQLQQKQSVSTSNSRHLFSCFVLSKQLGNMILYLVNKYNVLMYDNCEINTFTLMGLYYSELKYIYSIGLCLKNTTFVRLYMGVGMLLTRGNHLHDRIISLRVEVWIHITSLSQ